MPWTGSMSTVKSDNIEAIARTWCHWLRMRKESNPRRVTLTVWADYNVETTEEVLDKVWDTYLQYLQEIT